MSTIKNIISMLLVSIFCLSLYAQEEKTPPAQPAPPAPPAAKAPVAKAQKEQQAKDVQERHRGEKITKAFTVEKGGTLKVSVSGGDIFVQAVEKNEVIVNAYGIDKDDEDELEIEKSGNTVRVEFRPHYRHSSDARFEISVPTQFDVELKTSGGDIELAGKLAGKVKGSTSGGDIKIENAIGWVEMSTSGGDVSVGDVKGDVRLRTSGGDIELGDVSGAADIKTSGGDIRVQKVGKKLNASTAGGDVTVGDVGGEAYVSTSGGNVRVGKVSGRAQLKTAGGDIHLEGASGTVEAKTAGGDIELCFVSGSVEAKTAGGRIKAELYPTGKGETNLETAGGDIRITLPEDAKANITAEIRLEHGWKKRKYEIRSDFKEDKMETEEGERIVGTYTLNGGGERIHLETVNSNIEIRKAVKK